MQSSSKHYTINVETFGRNRHSAIIFAEYAEKIRRETGIDVYEMEARRQAEGPFLRQLLNRHRKAKTFSDESLLDGAWQEFLRDQNILTSEEQQVKDESSLQRARDVKADLQKTGWSDSARFGYCSKDRKCKNAKLKRLLVRGFCPDCRCISVGQNLPHVGESTLIVTVDPTRVRPQVLELTTEERREKVLSIKRQNPLATEREIAKLTDIPRSTIKGILKKPILKIPPENSDEIKQFLKERSAKMNETTLANTISKPNL